MEARDLCFAFFYVTDLNDTKHRDVAEFVTDFIARGQHAVAGHADASTSNALLNRRSHHSTIHGGFKESGQCL